MAQLVRVAIVEISSEIWVRIPASLPSLTVLFSGRARGLCPVTCRKVELIQKERGWSTRTFWGSRVRIPAPATPQTHHVSVGRHDHTRGNRVPQTFSQVKVETKTGSGEAPSSSKKWYNIMVQIMYLHSCCMLHIVREVETLD